MATDELKALSERLQKSDIGLNYDDLRKYLSLVRTLPYPKSFTASLPLPYLPFFFHHQQVRQQRIRSPELIAKYGSILLNKYHKQLPNDELWDVQEQVAVAALQSSNIDLAGRLIANIRHAFPSSSRSTRLLGMLLESQGKLVEAKQFYTNQLEARPPLSSKATAAFQKRLAALASSTGDYTSATDILSSYLQAHPNDSAVWEELADIHISTGYLDKAAYCLEELLLLKPNDPAVSLTYADVLYTISSSSSSSDESNQIRVALSYYAAAVEGSGGDSVRGLLGVCACTALLLGSKSSNKRSSGERERELGKVAKEALLQKYAREGAHHDLQKGLKKLLVEVQKL
jgi:ER membrane protein complex subunit 2